MAPNRLVGLLFATVALSLASTASAELEGISKLPVFFFHGIMGNRHTGDLYVANLTAEGRTVVPLSFCENDCSLISLKEQVPLAIAQVRSIVRQNPAFWNGYIFIAHSQGGQISRSVIENMDDHKVKVYISLAGEQNGLFYGPQDAEIMSSPISIGLYMQLVGDMFNFSRYSPADFLDGRMVRDLHQQLLLNPQLHFQYSMASHMRSPVFSSWAASNPHLPFVNNVNPCADHDEGCKNEKARRKANFLKLQTAHFFVSPDDGVVTPWQSSLLGQTSEVETLDAIVSDFANFSIVNMTATREYMSDTYGLQTLDKRGGLHLHQVPGVTHGCWINDNAGCEWQTTFGQYVYPLLQ